ncbi:MAG: amidohydrolase, partial [Acidobacteria bacterium]
MARRTLPFLFAAALIVSALAAVAAQNRATAPVAPADLVLQGGKIVTVDDARPVAEAMAVRGDTIVAVGPAAEIKPYIGPATKVIDLKGALAVPGLIDGHAHFTGVGLAAMSLRLATAKEWLDIVNMVAEAAKKAKPGEWIIGRGWHQEKWVHRPEPSIEGFPVHDRLSRVSPNNPVLLTHASGHAVFANAKAMELAGVTKTTPDPSGGKILKDAKDEPTGLFNERAQGLITRAHDA